MAWLVLLLIILLLQMPLIIFLEYRQPAKAIAWLLVLFMLPLVGFVMYYFIDRRFSSRQKKESSRENHHAAPDITKWKHIPKICPQADRRLLRLLSHFPSPSMMSRYNKNVVLTNGQTAFPAILEAMEQARHHIHIDYYIFREHGIGEQFTEIMIRKAGQGVEVRFLYDGIGSHGLTEEFIAKLESKGVETGCFSPPWLSLFGKRINYRNHRKIVIVDGQVGFFGGINVGDEYLGKDPKLGFWRDTHMRVEGEAVHSLQRTFMADWLFVKKQELEGEAYFPEVKVTSTGWVQIVAGGPDGRWEVIQGSAIACIGAAKHSIRIATPYFIPDPGLVSALKLAALSGVDVRILLPGIPDTRVIYWASLSYIKELLQSGVRFFCYQKGFMHAKVTLIDDCIGCVGTANMDLRSYYKNFELNALFFDPSVIARLEQDFTADLEDSVEITLEKYVNRSRLQKAKEVLAHVLSPLF